MTTPGPLFPCIAKTVSGLEEILFHELEALGASDLVKLTRAVSFNGDEKMMYQANYCCRTALRILKILNIFEVKTQEDLYTNILGMRWEDYVSTENTIAVDAVISDTVFNNSQYVALKTKDAIVDRMREKFNARPSIDLDNPDLRINVHLYKQLCTVSIDSSGQSLHKRGYRKNAGIAPLNEVLAAGLVILSGWDKKTTFYDPMCGSGTLPFEAAMYANNIPSGFFRKEFGFMKWKDFNPGLWRSVTEEENKKIKHDTLRIKGSDIAERSIKFASENIRLAGLSDLISLEVCSFEDAVPPKGKGTLLTNPPYNERLRIDDIIEFYKSIGNVLKKKYTGYDAWIISSDLNALKFIGLHPSKKITLFNGPLECRFVKFSLY